MSNFSSFMREDIFLEMEAYKQDILVIGGGITGAGIALDSVTRGLKTTVLEMQDFAAGTSSRSTKLIHGGLRYLKQLEIKVVAEVGKERKIVYENGPHVTTPEWMMLPFYDGGTFGKYTTNLGLLLYDFLAGVKKTERRKMFSPREAMVKEPLIKRDGLKGAGYYVEYKTDDARLTIEVMKKAAELGAHSINYAKVTEFIYKSDKVVGVVVEDQITGNLHKIYAKKIINATGPWVDNLREMDKSKQGKSLHLTKGVHLVFPKEKFPLQQAIYFDAPDNRMIFAIPRGDKTYVGTTDTTYNDEIASPKVKAEDYEYLIDTINFMFPSLKIDLKDVESSWAGIRPLIAEDGKNPNEISRKDEIFISDSGLFSIAGGKLTGYRKMAEQVIDKVVKQFKEEDEILHSDSNTRGLPISGGEVGGSQGFKNFKENKVEQGISLGLERKDSLNLVQRYGSNAEKVFNIYKEKADEAKQQNVDPVVFAQIVYGLEHEMVFKPADFFIRRTGALYFDISWVTKHFSSVISYMGKKLNWSNNQQEEYTRELNALIKERKPTEVEKSMI
ncbi:glycerol-3-phosphate dehydrogenase/oxidase [Virgibacillus doumboii]|uniref:glycerol-3-phosphate dehydrogenase/oxidase n=1 Tax=Virgibacillus doumboii TaxID=2697503 RepID=UPI0013E0656F|nr:glycerol-3-phosphate dehydrogenase/oxidase [Virgibacillus doumboii]